MPHAVYLCILNHTFEELTFIVCVKECRLIKIINMIILFACIVGWLDSPNVEIKKKLTHDL